MKCGGMVRSLPVSLIVVEVKMKIAIFEIGNFHDSPDIVRIFSSAKKAIENIPSEFEKRDSSPGYNYYEDKVSERWLSISEHKVEG